MMLMAPEVSTTSNLSKKVQLANTLAENLKKLIQLRGTLAPEPLEIAKGNEKEIVEIGLAIGVCITAIAAEMPETIELTKAIEARFTDLESQELKK